MHATLLREPIDADTTAARAALLLRGAERPFALIGAWAGGGAILGSDPVRVAGPGDDLFALLDERAGRRAGARRRGRRRLGRLPGLRGPPPRRAGAPAAAAPVPLPDGALAYYDHVLRLDAAGRWWFEALVTPGREAAIARRREELAARLAGPPLAAAVRHERVGAGPRRRAGHAEAVEACRARIEAGDLFQANLCLRLEGRLAGDALDLFATAARRCRPTAPPSSRARGGPSRASRPSSS